MALSIVDVADPSESARDNADAARAEQHAHKVQIAGDIFDPESRAPYFDKSVPASVPNEAGIKNLQHRETHGAARNRLPETTRQGRSPDVVHRRQVCPCRSDAAGIKERAYLIADISQPANPKEAGRWWIPGTKEGEETRPTGGRFPASIFTFTARFRTVTVPTSRWSTPAWSLSTFPT